MKTSYFSSRYASLKELLLPWRIFRHFISYRFLLGQFSWREVEKRYKGTLLGLVWSFITPLLMLSVYTVVFGFVFKGSYGHAGETKMQFVLGLFCGLLLWDFIGGSIIMAPSLILNNANFVTKVIFPLEILPLSMIAGSLLHMAIGFIPLLLLQIVSQKNIPITALFLIPIFIPIVLYVLGIVWILSALGTFLRDIGAMIPALLTIVMFMSAIFFPITAIPAAWRWVIMLNPAAVLISMSRNAVVFGQIPSIGMYGMQLIISLSIAIVGYAFFMKVKPAFADVL